MSQALEPGMTLSTRLVRLDLERSSDACLRIAIDLAEQFAPAPIAARETSGVSSRRPFQLFRKTILPPGRFTLPVFAVGADPTRSGLFSFERVFDRIFEAADSILNLALYLSALPSDTSFASPTALPTACLTAPLTCFADPTTRSLSVFLPPIFTNETHFKLCGSHQRSSVTWINRHPFDGRTREFVACDSSGHAAVRGSFGKIDLVQRKEKGCNAVCRRYPFRKAPVIVGDPIERALYNGERCSSLDDFAESRRPREIFGHAKKQRDDRRQ
jgi:hypothetical protein